MSQKDKKDSALWISLRNYLTYCTLAPSLCFDILHELHDHIIFANCVVAFGPVALLIWFLQNIHQRNLWLKPKIMATSGMHYMHLPTWSQHTALSLVAHRLMLDSHWSILRKELAMCGLDNPLIIQNTLTQAVNGDHWLPHKVPNMLLIHERQFQMWKAKIIGQLHPPCPSRALELAQPKSLLGFF